MTYVTWEIRRYARFGDYSWSTSYNSITTFQDPIIRQSLGDGKDTFSFKQRNFNGELNAYWNVGDKVEVYRAVNTSTIATSDLLLNGIATDAPNQFDGKKNSVSVTGANYSESLMNALVFVPIPSGGYTIPQFLAAGVNSVALHNPNFAITWNSGNPTVKSDGSAFPTVTQDWFYKSMTSALEEYSQSDTTQDGNYYWYVGIDNTVVWRRKTDTADYDFSTADDEYKSISIKKDISGVKNFVIAKGGNSPGGSAITIRYDDPVSRAKNGFKYQIIISKANNVTTVLDKDLGTDRTSNFPTSYNHTTYWGETVSSNGEYDTAVKEYVKARLLQEAKAYVEEKKYGKLVIEIKFEPGKGWGIGDVVNVTLPEIGKLSDPMRVKQAEYSTTTDRFWLEEDEGTI